MRLIYGIRELACEYSLLEVFLLCHACMFALAGTMRTSALQFGQRVTKEQCHADALLKRLPPGCTHTERSLKADKGLTQAATSVLCLCRPHARPGHYTHS